MARSRIAFVAALFLIAGTAWASDEPKPEAKDEPKPAAKEEPKPAAKEEPKAPSDAKVLGSEERCRHNFVVTGHPECISTHAKPTDTPGFCGYFVGGGSVKLWGSEPPYCPPSGTWGRDWCGIHFSPRVMLGWGDRYQGGMGAYRADGRTLVDPVDAIQTLPEVIHERRKERICGEQEH